MSKRFLRFPVLLVLLLLLTGQCLAAYSVEQCQRESYDPYTFGDLAMARLSVYGLVEREYRIPRSDTAAPLPRPLAVRLIWAAFATEQDAAGENPFSDVEGDDVAAVSWAFANGIAAGRAPAQFGVYPVTEQAFVTMLLNAMGYRNQFTYGEAFDFAKTVGLSRPLGISRTFCLGDAALYLQAAMSLKAPDGTSLREKMNVPRNAADVRGKQATFPVNMVLYPSSRADAEAQMELATRYLAASVEIHCDGWPVRDLLDLCKEILVDGRDGKVWFAERLMDENSIQPRLITRQVPYSKAQVDLLLNVNDSPDAALLRELFQEEESVENLSLRLVKSLSVIRFLSVAFRYNEAWELACDLDDAFTCYRDDALTSKAGEFYQTYVAGAKDPLDAFYRAKTAVTKYAAYANMTGYVNGQEIYPEDAHSIAGFFSSGRIVCDGYAKVFQYLMHRAGVPCVTVSGSIISPEQAEKGITDHAWNKVLLNGRWLNADICWADTGWPTTFDLKTDSFYAMNRHWIVTFAGLK